MCALCAKVRGQLSESVPSFHLSVGTGEWLWVRLAKHRSYEVNHLTDKACILLKFGESGDAGVAVVRGCFSLLKKSLVILLQR